MRTFSRRTVLAGVVTLPIVGANPALAQRRRVGAIRRIDPGLDAVIDSASPIEVLGEGYGWAEGPVWLPRQGWLLFSDVPGNTIWRWRPRDGMDIFMRPSGLEGPVPAAFNEAGANALALDPQGRLIMADSGNRAVARVDLVTRSKTILASRFMGRRFNSPNTVAVARNGTIYFTDPPYGLKDPDRSPLRELAFQGLYRLDTTGGLTLLDKQHRRPNGIALSRDERTLFLALSDETRPELLAYPLSAKGQVGAPRLFHNMREQMRAGGPGLPDGVAVDPTGRVFVAGPGGVHVLTPQGKLLGIIATGKAVANLCLGHDGAPALFMTSHDMVARVTLKA